MARATTLTKEEISLIRGMIHWTRLNDQVIISYFSRPGRDLNHRIVGEIRNNGRWASIARASADTTFAYLFIADENEAVPADLFIRTSANKSLQQPLCELRLDWWPVGQGLFSSGIISTPHGGHFNWVYDCGTDSRVQHLNDAIGDYERQQHALGVDKICLGVLSHLDNDHISGLTRLLSKFKIETLLLPHMPNWQRLLVALEMGASVDDPTFDFYLDPIAYLDRVAPNQIGQVVFVPQSGPDDSPPPTDESPEPPSGSAGEYLEIKIEFGDTLSDGQDDRALENVQTQVRFLRAAGRMIIPGLWEFVPYNDARLAARVSPAAIRRISRLRSIMLRSPKRRKAALSRLKAVYDGIFTSSKVRNEISLFLYAGPVPASTFVGRITNNPSGLIEMDRCSQMLTGDGYLTIGRRFKAFENFFGPGGRISRSAFLQVMHHGAEGNWHRGLAEKLKPACSIFSSEPTGRHGHPHAPVLRDFWNFGPVQVDTCGGFHAKGVVFRR